MTAFRLPEGARTHGVPVLLRKCRHGLGADHLNACASRARMSLLLLTVCAVLLTLAGDGTEQRKILGASALAQLVGHRPQSEVTGSSPVGGRAGIQDSNSEGRRHAASRLKTAAVGATASHQPHQSFQLLPSALHRADDHLPTIIREAVSGACDRSGSNPVRGATPYTGESAAPGSVDASARVETSGTAVPADHRAVFENLRDQASNSQFAKGSLERASTARSVDPERSCDGTGGVVRGARASRSRASFTSLGVRRLSSGSDVVRPTAWRDRITTFGARADRDGEGGKTPELVRSDSHSENAGKLARASDRTATQTTRWVGASRRRDRGESSASTPA